MAAIALIVGFALGYGVAWISRGRRQADRQRRSYICAGSAPRRGYWARFLGPFRLWTNELMQR